MAIVDGVYYIEPKDGEIEKDEMDNLVLGLLNELIDKKHPKKAQLEDLLDKKTKELASKKNIKEKIKAAMEV